MSNPSPSPQSLQQDPPSKEERERVSADEILENAVELGDYAVLDMISEGVVAVGEFIGGLADIG
jgi:hypothetical protein